MDMGGGSIDELAGWFGEVAQTLADAGVRLTICSPLTSELATLDSILRITEHVGENADYVIVRNRAKGDTSEIEALNTFKEYQKVIDPLMVTMEALRSDIADVLDAKGLSPAKALAASDEQKGPTLASASARIRLTAWNDKLGIQFGAKPVLLP